MKKIIMRLIALVLLTMFSMGAGAAIEVTYGKDGSKDPNFTGGKVLATPGDEKDGKVTFTLDVLPDNGYTITKDDIEVYATISPAGTRANPEISKKLDLEGKDPANASDKRTYTFTIESNFGVWVKEAKFLPDGSKGGSEPSRSTTDYSGTYYIGSRGYDKANTTTNFYLCPTEGWAFYVATNNVQSGDNGQPFLTTYQCRNGSYDATKAVWVVEKELNSGCYYIKQAKTGKYMVSNGVLPGAANTRARVHLETVADAAALATLGDMALFEINYDDGHYDILPHSTGGRDGANNIYLVVNTNNYNQLNGNNVKTNGPTGFKNCGGIIGLYTHPDDGNAYFYFEETPVRPTITNNFDGTFTITATSGATIYYTTDDTPPTTETTTTGTTSVTFDQTENMTVIRAIAKGENDFSPSKETTYELPVCERPVISVSGGNVSITCATEGATIHYTTNGDPATSSSTPYSEPFAKGSATAIRAIATKAGYVNSSEATLLPPTEVSSSDAITNMAGLYILSSNFNSTASIGTSENPFRGTIDGNLVTLSGLDHPLVGYAEGAIIKNVILDNVNISSGTNVGAICGEAKGDTRIYNCGVLATNSTAVTDDKGYTSISYCSSSVTGSGDVGGIVGLLDGSSRVINCFSYANVNGGNYAGGIVGYNNVATTATNLKTMVMNCMFYGEVSGSSIAPIYNGKLITNVGENKGVGNYNYFRMEAAYIQNSTLAKVYNCALGAETRFLQRFEFFRHLLNGHRELAAWWATGSTENKDEMMKWVLLPSQIGTSTPYPILRTPGKYPSVVNIDAEHAPTTTERNKGGKLGTLSVTIQSGSGAVFSAPDGASITTPSLTLNITDKDFEHFNFNYGKVQLPYYNDVGTKNYTGNRVVTGWKIVSITDGEEGEFSTSTADAPSFNFADRHCTKKDLYSVSGRVFNQGAYWDVPEGVTGIIIQPYWAKAAYLADAHADVVYNQNMTTAFGVPNVGGGEIYTNGSSYPIAGDDQLVYTTVADAIGALGKHSDHKVYDYAIVLVGNVHNIGVSSGDKDYPYSIMSIDADHDNEPDYSYILRFDSRSASHAVRVDFLNMPGLGMAQKSTGGTGTYNFGILQPLGWFESTNTSLFRVTQFEYDNTNRAAAPYIVQGGVMEQWVSGQNNGASNNTTYYHVGGNVWFKEFHRGTHQDKQLKSKHPPISVTGGDYDEFYLTGLYRGDVGNYEDNAECYINGGRFGVVAGAAMEGIGKALGANNTGNITWQVQNADIDEFYGGGFNAAHPVEGNITTNIEGGYIKLFCGGPKFGDMNTGKTVTTTANGCIFDTYFGGGYGGNSYSRFAPANINNIQGDYTEANWNTFVNNNYKQEYNSTYKGVSTSYTSQYLPMSNNTQNVARVLVDFVSFSLATTRNVTSTLTGCTINQNFYGGGSLGMVDGPVTSTLTDCHVAGNVFGAGYSASLPTVLVMKTGGFVKAPFYDKDLGAYFEPEYPGTDEYTWEHKETVNSTATAIDKNNHILYTTEKLDALGTVTGKATLNIDGTTVVGGNVFGGGDSSDAKGNTEVNMKSGMVQQNIYGGGNQANVGGDTQVNLKGGTVTNNVYGGGKGDDEHYATVGNTEVILNGTVVMDGEVKTYPDNCIVNGSIFGCNDVNGTPLGIATVHIYKTNGDSSTASEDLDNIDDTKHHYHLNAVYGGGNLAAYIPTADDAKANVIIDGCDLTSIRTVYGGGNAASTPATSVVVNGTYEIEEVFGGGNGKDALPDGSDNPGANVGFKNYSAVEDTYSTKEQRQSDEFVNEYVYGSGEANVTIVGGRVHRVFGGSNTKGNVRITAVTMLDDLGGCHFIVDEAYGGGKSAPMDGEAKLLMSCIPGLKVAYGGAEDANILGDVTLNITNGNFDRVFGGNNISGTIGGKITVNVEETGCNPIIIGQLYGGGNQAPYDAHGQTGPTLNIKSFTSIGEVYGGGYGVSATVTGDTHVNINEVKGKFAAQTRQKESRTISFSEFVRNENGDFLDKDGHVTTEDSERVIVNQQITVDIPAFTANKIGGIGMVYGGGNAAKVDGNTHVNIGTQSTIDFVTGVGSAQPQTGVVVEGVNIIGNVYGGGNKADVTGNTNVVVGKQPTN